MSKLLALFSGPTLWWVVGGLVLVVAAAFGVQKLRLAHAQHQLTVERADRAEERAVRAETAASATAARLKESERREAAQQGVINATKPALDAARDAADRLPDLDRRVRALTAQLGACRRAGRDDPAAPAGGTPAEETERVLAELQRGAQAAEAARARYADEAAGAGARCERIYDSLKPGMAVTGAE